MLKLVISAAVVKQQARSQAVTGLLHGSLQMLELHILWFIHIVPLFLCAALSCLSPLFPHFLL